MDRYRFYLRSIPRRFSKVLVPSPGTPIAAWVELEELNTLEIFILLQSKVLNSSLHLQHYQNLKAYQILIGFLLSKLI